MTYARDPYDTDQPPCLCDQEPGPVYTTAEFCPAHGDPAKPAPESPDPYFPQARSWTDEYGTTHYSLDNAVGGARGPAEWTSEHDCNPVCGCHLASKCRGCNVCTNCDGCYCGEDDY